MYVQGFVAILCFFFLLSAIESNVISNLVASNPTVKLPRYGSLKGSIGKTAWTNRKIYQFLGVKYAESPSGSRRFKAPVPVKPWSGVRDAQNFGLKCPVLTDLLKMSERVRKRIDLEDCLNMEIYSPKLTASLPVMVYVHGGSFYQNSAHNYPPNYFLEHDVILVVVQYRLDALGFLSTNTADIPGNAALMDVQLALTFVKENIKYFGGNPSKVTLFGQSSGAAMVSALAISPAVPADLFNRVILHSGSVLSKWSVSTDPVTDARDIAQAAGLDPTQFLTVLNKAFIKMDVVDLLTAVDQYQKNSTTVRSGARSLSIGGPNNLLPDLPQKIIASSQINKTIPMIIGATKDDGSFVVTGIYDSLKAKNLTKIGVPFVSLLIQMMCSFHKIGDYCATLQSVVGNTFWTQDELASTDFAKIAPGLIDLLGTVFFKAPALGLALSNARWNAGNTFLYTFDYQGRNTRFGYGEDTSHYPFKGGVTHSDDLIYLFPYPLDVTDMNKADKQMAEQFLNLWTSFAANGQPQTSQTCTDDIFSWPPVQSGTFGPYAHIDEKLTIGNDFTKELVGHASGKTDADYKNFIDLLLSLP